MRVALIGRTEILYETAQVLINNGHASEHDGNIDPHTLRENVVEIQRLRYSLQVFLKST